MIGWRGAWLFGDELPFQGVPGLLPMTPEIERLYRACLRARPGDGTIDAELDRLRRAAHEPEQVNAARGDDPMDACRQGPRHMHEGDFGEYWAEHCRWNRAR